LLFSTGGFNSEVQRRCDLLADGYSHAARLADQWPAKAFVVVDQREDHEPYAEFLQSPRDRATLQDRGQGFAGRNNPCFLPGKYRLPDYGTGNAPYRRIRLGEFALEVIGVHHPLVNVLVRGEGTGPAEQLATSMILPWLTWAMMAMLRIGRSDMGKA